MTNHTTLTLDALHTHFETFLEQQLPKNNDEPNQLATAMRYSVLNGGKRLRPLLVYSVGALFNIAHTTLDCAAAAIELIHCYSLVHDDLPCMDDDDFRRGKPSCHKQFDEATAVLVGDALQTLAFELISTHPCDALTNADRVNMIRILSQASGFSGMCGGQMLDMQSEEHWPPKKFETLHAKKTGALFEACFLLGSLQQDKETRNTLLILGKTFGLAFQLQDDILDYEQHPKHEHYIKQIGIHSAKEKLAALYKQQETILSTLENAALLKACIKRAMLSV